MTQNLEELKQKLYGAFDRALQRSESNYMNEETLARNAGVAASLAQAIVAVEIRLDERNQEKNGIRLPGKG